jgi:hypothetical protein
MALTYSQLAVQAADESFIQRVQEALIQDCNANRVAATTPANGDVTMSGQRDKLGRRILLDPHSWAITFARVIAINLIAKATLLDPAVTTDADIFSAESAVYDRFLPSL